jgi:site-specific DNA-methyltransferase (adenine-specific)
VRRCQTLTPYYEEPGITIYCGDCAEIAPTLGQFDLLCTDPPYGIGEARKDHGSRRRFRDKRPGRSATLGAVHNPVARSYDRLDWDDRATDQSLIDALRELATYTCLFGGNFFEMPPSPSWLVWDKDNGECDFADCELAWTNYGCAIRRKRHQWNGMLRGGVAGKSAEPRYHPTQKPLAVMSWAIGLCPERPTSVLDPFMGSGTTLRACKNLGIRAVGIEREERYCKIAVDRLRQATLFGVG